MKQYRITLLVVFVVAFLALAEACAQTVKDGQPSVLKEDKAQANYVYDLKVLIKKSKDNIKTVNEKIKEQAVIKRNQQREEKAREYYQQALKLQEEGRLEEARQLFDKAIRITEHPEMTYYIKESERRSKLQAAAIRREETDQERRLMDDQRALLERAETSYAAAVSLYKQQKFHEAKDEFQLVEEMLPDYKAVRSYLQIVEQDIVQADQLNIKEQKKEIERQQKDVEIARLREKELWRKEIDKKEEERQQQLRKQAQLVYDEAIKLYDGRQYLAAREKFQQVEWVVPDFKAVRAYLNRIENDVQDEKKQLTAEKQRELEKQRWEEVLKEKKAEEDRRKALELREQARLDQVREQAEYVYLAAVALFEKDLLAQAKDKFDEVEGIYPNYKSTRDFLKRIDTSSKQLVEREMLKKKTEEERRIWEEEMARRKEEKETFKKLTLEADTAYENALRLYQTGRLIEAKEQFLEVDKRVPDYKSSRSYLKRIDADIELLAKTQKSQLSLAEQREEVEKMRALREKAEPVYAQALQAYDAKDFKTAKIKFAEVETILPEYKKTKAYLGRIEDDMRQYEEALARANRGKEAEAAYAQAVAFYQAGKYEEAKGKFLAVETIWPDYKQTPTYLGRIDDDILRKKESDLLRMKETQVSGLYNQAMAFYQSSDYVKAKERLLQVEVIYPGYKETSRVLASIDAQIEKQKKEAQDRLRSQQAEQIYAKALELYQAGDLLEAKKSFVEVEVLYSGYKDTLKYLSRIDGDIVRKKKDDELRVKSQQAEPIYAQAVDLYKGANFLEAKNKFIQVDALIPGYKDTAIYLSRVNKDIIDLEARLAKEEKGRKCEGLYTEAVKFYVNRQFAESKAKFIELMAIDSGYKNVRTYLANIDKDIVEEELRQRRSLAEQQAAEPYAQAVTLYHDGDFESAKIKFLEAFKLAPDYQRTEYYLARIDQDINAKKSSREKESFDKAAVLYREAIELFVSDKIGDAYKKFNDVEAIYPNYKAVRANLDRIQRMAAAEGIVLTQGATLQAAPVTLASEAELVPLYKEGIQLYKDNKYDEAVLKFEAVNKIYPGYRSTQNYLDSIKEIKNSPVKAPLPERVLPSDVRVKKTPLPVASASATKACSVKMPDPKPVVVPVKVTPPPVKKPEPQKPQVTKEDTRSLSALSARSSSIYQQIKALSEEKQLSNASRTFAQVDRLIDNLEAERQRVAAEVARQKKAEADAVAKAKGQEKDAEQKMAKEAADQAAVQKKADQDKTKQEAEAKQAEMAQQGSDLRQKERAELERLKDEQRETQLKAEVVYQQGLVAFRAKDHQTAHDRFIDAQKIVPDYKDTSKLLLKIERAQGEAALVVEESKDRAKISTAAQKAAELNVEILELSNKKEYEAVEKRFNDLETILKEIQGIKQGMVDRREHFEADWENRAVVRKAENDPRVPPKSSKPLDLEGTPRERAVALFREGEQLYRAGQYPEARVKFIESIQTDPTYKASMSFVHRLDRILAKKDFEVSTEQQKMRSRDLKRKEEGIADKRSADSLNLPDAARAAQVCQEGIALYKERRYREAQIKFEELSKVGNEVDQRTAMRYLGLVDKALNKEKLKKEADQKVQEERFLQERRAQAKMEWERGKLEQERQQRLTRKFSGTERDNEISREQAIRDTEEENARQRRRMLEKKAEGDAEAEKKKRQERNKYIHEARQKKLPVDVAAAENKELAQQVKADEASANGNVVLTDPKTESEARSIADVTKHARSERRRLDQLESAAQRERRQKEEQMRRRVEKEEQRRRQAAEKWAKEKKAEDEAEHLASRIKEEKEKFKKDTDTDAFIRRNQEAVEAILKEEPLVDQAAKPVVVPPAVVEQKRRLDEQRAAIRKDFEDGVERLYAGAIELYKKNLFQESKADLIQVDGLIKGYKKTAQYLKEIDRAIAKARPAPVVPAVSASKSAAAASVTADTRARVVTDVLDTFDVNTKQ